jgi:hypothetical protein
MIPPHIKNTEGHEQKAGEAAEPASSVSADAALAIKLQEGMGQTEQAEPGTSGLSPLVTPYVTACQIGLQQCDTATPGDLLQAAKHLGPKAMRTRTSIGRLPLRPLSPSPEQATLRRTDITTAYQAEKGVGILANRLPRRSPSHRKKLTTSTTRLQFSPKR